MKIAQSVRFGAWLVIIINLIMAFGSIWIFTRMAPAIEVILARNAVSLESCSLMQTALLQGISADATALDGFKSALADARENITEQDEPEVIDRIHDDYEDAFAGDLAALDRATVAIAELRKINRQAMHDADARAKQLGYAGAWGVVFMATLSFLIAMLFLRSLDKNLTEPMEEINTVVASFNQGDRMRRCSLANTPRSVKQVFNNINELLDINNEDTACLRQPDSGYKPLK